MPSKNLRLSGAAQAALVDATRDLPEGATTSERVLVMAQRLRVGSQGTEGGVSREDLRQELQALRFRLLSDFADAG